MLYGNQAGPFTLHPGLLQYAFGGITPPPYSDGKTEFAELLSVLAVNAKSVCIAVPGVTGGGKANTQRQITWSTEFPSAPATVSVILQAAMRDNESEYATLDTTTLVTGEARTVASNFIFHRVLLSAFTGGTAPSIICKLRCM